MKKKDNICKNKGHGNELVEAKRLYCAQKNVASCETNNIATKKNHNINTLKKKKVKKRQFKENIICAASPELDDKYIK